MTPRFTVPANWTEIAEEQFVDFLKHCADYRRDNYSYYSRYYYTHNNQEFAVVEDDKVFIKPKELFPV